MEKQELQFSNALVNLLKGVVNIDKHPKVWNTIMSEQIAIENYVAKIGLTLVIQKQDGYAYLKQRGYSDEDAQTIPRLVATRQLGFITSLLLVTLRKEYAEINRSESGDRVILSESEIIEKLRPYLSESTDEVKQLKTIISSIKKLVEMGFLQKLKTDEKQYEISPLVRGFVDAQWLEEFDAKLETYRQYQKMENEIGDEDELI